MRTSEVGLRGIEDAGTSTPPSGTTRAADATSEAIVALRDLVVAPGEHAVIDGLSCTIERGQFCGIIGPSGAGKTTLLRTLLGMVPIRSGSAHVFGAPAGQLGERALRIGYVPQQPDLDRRFPATVRDVVMFGRVAGLGMLRRPRALDREQVASILATVGLEGSAAQPIETLSVADLRRASLARALASEPELLLVDEPGDGLDAGARSAFHELLSRLRAARGLTVIAATRELAAIAPHADELLYVGRAPGVRGASVAIAAS